MVIGVARIFDWRGPNHKSHAMTPSNIFERRNFVGQRHLRMEDQKPVPGVPRNQDFVIGEALNQKLQCFHNMS